MNSKAYQLTVAGNTYPHRGLLHDLKLAWVKEINSWVLKHMDFDHIKSVENKLKGLSGIRYTLREIQAPMTTLFNVVLNDGPHIASLNSTDFLKDEKGNLIQEASSLGIKIGMNANAIEVDGQIFIKIKTDYCDRSHEDVAGWWYKNGDQKILIIND